ncbi:hypothetical protein [Nostoc sp.]|uniref:hypothetical protein n=1 Tax=Nostoc sp. TaxID=1180 RepID=UPI002FF90F50
MSFCQNLLLDWRSRVRFNPSSCNLTQKSIAKKIIEADADYVFSLKDNHPILHQQVKNWFEIAQSLGFKDVDVNISQRVSKGDHRIENRQVYHVGIFIP